MAAICGFVSFQSTKASDFVAVQAVRGSVNHLFVPVSVNGKRANWWLVDTGAPYSVIRPAEMTRAGIANPQPQLSTTGEGKHPIVSAANITSEGMDFGKKSLVVISPEHFDEEGTRESTGSFHKMGVMGLDLLMKYGAIINSRSQQLFFSKIPGHLPVHREQYEKMGFTYIPLEKLPSGHVGVDGTVNGTEYTFILDTGAPFTTLQRSIGEKEKLPRFVTASSLQGSFHDFKNARLDAASLPGFKIGSQDLSDALIGFANLNLSTGNLKHPFGGFIGADILFYHTAIIDLGNDALYLAPDFRKKT
jgi:predicted aspartyl protease